MPKKLVVSGPSNRHNPLASQIAADKRSHIVKIKKRKSKERANDDDEGSFVDSAMTQRFSTNASSVALIGIG